MNLTEVSLSVFGRGFFSFESFLPVFLSYFTDSKILIALVGSLTPVGWLLPQLFIVPLIESLPRKKNIVIHIAFYEKFVHIFLAILAYYALDISPTILVSLILLVCFLIGLGGGLTRIGWSELLAIIFPAGLRGRYFGIASFSAGLMGALGAYLGGRILSQYDMPKNFMLTFLVGFGVTLFSWTFLFWLREPPPRVLPGRRVSQTEFFSGLTEILRKDHQFRSFLLAQSMAVAGRMALIFLTVYGLGKFSLLGYQVGILATFLMLGNTLAAPIFGWLGDRYTRRRLLIIGSGLQALGFALAVLSPDIRSLYIAIFTIGLGQSSLEINSRTITYDYAPETRRPTYIGLASTTFGLVTVVMPLIAGTIAQFLGYENLFIVSMLLSVMALIFFLIQVKEPTRVDNLINARETA